MSYIEKLYPYDIVYNIHDIIILNDTTSCPRHTMSEGYDVVSFRCYDIVCLGHDVGHMTDTTSGIVHDVVSEDRRRTWSTYQMEVIDPSAELIAVANTFLSWYKLYRRITHPKTLDDVATLKKLSQRLQLL